METTTCEHYSKPMGWRPLLNKESSLSSNKKYQEQLLGKCRMGEMDQTRATSGSNESKEQDSYRHVSLLAFPQCHCWRGTFFFENELAWYLADVNFTTTSLHHSPRITRARTRDGSTKTNPPFITATFVTCEIIIMTVCDYMNLS